MHCGPTRDGHILSKHNNIKTQINRSMSNCLPLWPSIAARCNAVLPGKIINCDGTGRQRIKLWNKLPCLSFLEISEVRRSEESDRTSLRKTHSWSGKLSLESAMVTGGKAVAQPERTFDVQTRPGTYLDTKWLTSSLMSPDKGLPKAANSDLSKLMNDSNTKRLG